MLNKRNIFLSAFLAANFMFVSSLYADNPGEVVAQVDDVAEEVVTETVSDAPSSPSESASSVSSASGDEVELSKISVTGSRIKRTDIEGPQPLVVITSDDIDQGGFLSVYEAVSSVAQNTGQTVMDGLGGGSNNASNNQLNLRDFGPGRTLILVNGKRRANYPYPEGDGDASFNWNRIPIGIVERIEILTSGASAIYGADAVAGVVNVILVDGMEEFAVQLRVGEHQPFTNRSSGESVNIEISGGKYFDNGSMVFGIDLSTVNPLRGTDREQLDDITDEPVGYYHYGTWAGYLAARGYSGYALLPQNSGATTTCEQLSMRTDSMQNYGWGQNDYTDPTTGKTWDALGRSTYGDNFNYCNIDDGKYSTIRNGSDNASVYLAGTYNFDNGVELTADIHYWDTEVDSVSRPKFVIQNFYATGGVVGEDGTLLADGSGNIFYEGTDRTFSPAMFAFGGAYMQGQRFFPESEWRGTYKEDTLSYTLAATGNFDFRDAIWDWELALVNDEYNFQRGGLEVTESGLEAWSCGAAINTVYASSCNSSIYGFSLFNPDTFWGPASLAESYGLWKMAYINGDSSSISIQFNISGDLFTLPAGPVGFALHLDDTTTDYQIRPDQTFLDDDIWGRSTTRGGGERSRESAAIEFAIPVTADFSLYAARRYDSYDEISTQIGSRSTDQLSFTWKATENMMIRGGWGESFAAPSLPYIYKGESSSFSTPCDYYARYYNTGVVNLDSTNCLADKFTQLNATLSSTGNLNLRAEDGEQYNLGFVFDLIDTSKVKMDMTLDFVEIELADIVISTSTTSVLIDEMICKAQEDGITTPGYTYGTAYCADIYSSVVRGAEWQPQGGGTNPNTTPPEGGIDTVKYGYINGATRFYRGADLATSTRFLTDNAGDFFVSLSIAYVDDERRANGEGDPLQSIMNQERRLRSRSYLSFSWTKNDWAAGISTSRIGSMNYSSTWNERGPNSYGNPRKIDPYYDIGSFVRYDFADGHFLQVSVSNLMDDIPEKNVDLGWPWFADYYYSPVGREVFLTYRYTF
jgi:outer membrane receptor protein involved in Fe transport